MIRLSRKTRGSVMSNLRDVLKSEISKYVGSGIRANSRLFLMLDDHHQLYAVNSVDEPRTDAVATVLLMARIVGDTIIIEEDHTATKLAYVLMMRGIPPEQIKINYYDEDLLTNNNLKETQEFSGV